MNDIADRPTVQSSPADTRRFSERAGSWLSQWAIRLHLQPPVICPRCGFDATLGPLYWQLRVCGRCGFHWPCPVGMRINSLVDPHSFSQFAAGREAVMTGTATMGGIGIVLVIFDFAFIGGTMSRAVGERVTRAFERAVARKLPLVAVISTGGVRVQEGLPALLQMAKTTLAVEEFKQVGRLFISVSTNPTTGGVYASFASLADVIFAEPGAVIGFAGPRVAEAITGEKLPPDSHRAETLYKHGLVDRVIPRMELRTAISQMLAAANAGSRTAGSDLPRENGQKGEETSPAESGDGQGIAAQEKRTAWQAVTHARLSTRPTSLDYIPRLFDSFSPLHGDRVQADDDTVVGGLAVFKGTGCIVVAQQRVAGKYRRGAGPAGYRKAERLIHLAERLDLPVITLVDTPGADPSNESEIGGLAGAIAHCLSAFVGAPVPTVSVIIGEATSGGGLALSAADRVLILQDATYMVISPEGASGILYGDANHAAEAAERLRLNGNCELVTQGIVDEIIPIRAAETSPDQVAALIRVSIAENLARLEPQTRDERMRRRRARYRTIG